MIIGRKSCSRTLSERGRPCSLRLGEAKARAVASSELGSASFHTMGVASLPKEVKPAPDWEATTVGTDRTPRGERRARAQKEPPGTWETRLGVRSGQPLTGSHNRRRGRTAVSDGFNSSWEVSIKSGWSQGALARVMPSQK